METEFSKHLGYYIQELSRKMSIILNNRLQETGLTFSQFRAINCLWKKGALTQKEIHEIIFVQPSTLTGIIDILEKKGFVVRRVDENDARIKRIDLTEEGKAIQDRAWSILEGFEEEFENTLEVEERFLMLKWLKSLNKKIDEI